MARPTGRNLRAELIQEATIAMQTEGTSFSFNQLAKRLGVRAPSLHHHFRRKDDLIAAAVTDYIAGFETTVATLSTGSAIERLNAYVTAFTAPARDGRFCLCGALTADWEDTAPPVRKRIAAFFDDQLVWVQATVERGQVDGELRSDLAARDFAHGFVAALEGALLLARVSPDVEVAAGPLTLVQMAAR